MLIRSLRSRCAVVAAALFASLVLPTVAASPAFAAAAPAATVKGVYVVQASTETWADAVSRQIADYPSFRSDVAALLPTWTTRAKKGAQLGLSGVNNGGTQLDQLARVGAALKNPASVKRQPGVFSTAAAAHPTASRITPMFVDVNNPNSWAVRGNIGSNGNTYWSNLLNIISINFCSPSGCKITDTMASRSQVNPGATSDKISITQAYYPSSGAMYDSVEYSFKSINKSNVTGTGFAYLTSGPGKVGANGAWTQGNGKNYKGTYLTVGVGMGVVIYVPPYNGDRMWDGGKTRDAICSATTCHY